jgi:DNA adenine methylase
MGVPSKSPVAHYGGKANMVGHILPLIPPHELYCEPFCGGANVFWSRPLLASGQPPSPIEVLNDLNRDLINFYRVFKDNPDRLVAMIAGTLHSRAEFDRARDVLRKPADHDATTRAWAYWVTACMSYNGKGNNYAFGNKLPSDRPKRFDRCTRSTANRREALQVVDAGGVNVWAKRLALVNAECKDALYCIKTYDTKRSFFYCDPPYINTEQGNYAGYGEPPYIALLETLAGIKGKFILSSYPNAILALAVAEYGWRVDSFDKSLSAAKAVDGKRVERRTELLVRNFDDNILIGAPASNRSFQLF